MAGPEDPPKGKVVGVYEMLWDCAFCDTKALLGKTNRYCPNCGAPQDPKKRYFPEEGKEVAINTTYEGVDLVCPACQTPNGAASKCCRHCGSPLNEAGKVALVGRQQAEAAKAKAAPPPPKRRSVWAWILGALALSCVVFSIIAASWKKDVTVTVVNRTWERSIDIEAKRANSESAWCDSVPSGAYGLSRHKEQRSTKRIPDGQSCHTEKHDRGDGTFEKREVCSPKYKEEPVYDDRCSYTIDHWGTARTVRASGTVNEPVVWPQVSLGRACDSLGCEREGPRHETFTAALKDSGGESYTCDLSESRWRALEPGKSYPIKVRVVTGGADCDTL